MTFSHFRAAEQVRRRLSQTVTLARRDPTQLSFVQEASAGTALLLDTCVYIDQMQGRLPTFIDHLISVRIVHHSMVAVQELMHTVGVLDPLDTRSRAAIRAIEVVINAMPPHRLLTPDADVLASAAIQAGILARLQGYAKDDRMGALHDCVLFQQAMKQGLVVLTRNIRDFDLLLQTWPNGRVLFYRV